MEYIYTWNIENYSYCLEKNTEALFSPKFTSGLENTAWCMRLYPRGRNIQSKGHISLILERSELDDGPENILLKYELSLLGADGSAAKSKELSCRFIKGGDDESLFIHMHELFFHKKDTLLSRGTLTVRCKMHQIDDGGIYKVRQSSARTIIGTEHVCFLHAVKSFSQLRLDELEIFNIRCSTRNVQVKWSIQESSTGKYRLVLKITSDKGILSTCNLFLVGASGILTKCGEEDNRSDVERNDISRLPLSLTRRDILDRKEEYLPEDKLTVLCQCTFSTGVIYQNIERTLLEIPSTLSNQINID